MRKIAVIDDDFINEKLLAQIRATADECGFSVDYYPDEDAACARASEYEVLYGYCKPEFLRRMEKLKWFSCDFAGVENLTDDSLYCDPNVLLTNGSGSYGITISEHIVMTALMLLRNMPAFQQSARQCRWSEALPMRSLYGRTITVVGAGNVGAAFARTARAMGAGVIHAVRRTLLPADSAFTDVHTAADLDLLLPETELLVLCAPGTPETKNILSRDRIALLPPSAIVINVGRGNAVDQDALCDALNAGRIAGAALDVMTPEPLPSEHPMWKTKNLLITPHVSGNMTVAVTQEINVAQFCENLRNYAANRPLARSVDRKRGY